MDIKTFRPQADVTFELETTNQTPISIRFTVEFVALDAATDHLPEAVDERKKIKLSRLFRELLIDAVRGWDLTLDGRPLECNEETKRMYLPTILGYKVKPAEGQAKATGVAVLGNVLVWRLMNFAGEMSNFVTF